MIACTYCGRANEDSAVHCRECGTELTALVGSKALSRLSNQEFSGPDVPDKAVHFDPLQLPGPRLINPAELDGAFQFEDGFHRADWKVIREWIDSRIAPPDMDEAWNEAALLWVAKLRDDLGGNYFVIQSRQTVLLCDQPLETARRLLDFAGRTATTIKECLDTTAWSGAFGKDVVLVFSDQDDYYQYLSYHTPDGEQATSGGVCIHTGYTHIALPWYDELIAANTIVHELIHNCLAHLPLPLWLNEGMAVTLEKAIAPAAHATVMWDELADRHFAFWTEETIQSFWAGTSFSQPGDPNELSYSLAEVFVKLLSERGEAAAFRAFLQAAHRDDAGQTAAMDVLGADLGGIAGTFLGEGNWRPLRKAMVACWEAAGRNERRKEDEEPLHGTTAPARF